MLQFREVSFMHRLLYNYQISHLEWSVSCLVCFTLKKLPFTLVIFMPRLFYP